MNTIEKSFELFAAYFQFYIRDEKSSGIDGDSWTETALQARLALESDTFAVSTARNMDVPVEIAITDDQPSLDYRCGIVLLSSHSM